MKKITTLTNNAFQKLSIVNDDSLVITLELRFLPTQKIWIYNIEQDDFIVNGRSLVISPNMLNRFTNIIEFGMSATSTDGYETYKIDDFSSGRVNIYILNSEEKDSVDTNIFQDTSS